jgi:xylan 1,4-beta-xylosidase
MAARSDHSITVLVWNYHDDDVATSDIPVSLTINGIPTKVEGVLLRHYRIDRDHSNAFTLWKEMGSPQIPTPEQYAKLKSAGQLELLGSPSWIKSNKGTTELTFSLPGQALSLVEISW